jgi:hypothetical protein
MSRGHADEAMNTDRTLIVVPTYNERENVPELIRQIARLRLKRT